VAYAREQDERATGYLFAAMQAYVDPELKVWAMHDLATVLVDLGHLRKARTILTTIRDRRHPNVRFRNNASLNLMRIATLVGDRPQFDHLRRELAGQRLSAEQRVHYHAIAGHGCLEFGQAGAARDEFARASVAAETYRVQSALLTALRP
jgi:hypothetical protein